MKINGYDYKERKKKVEEILDNTNKINEVDKFPRDEEFTYENGYNAWAGAIFVDLRDSTKLFANNGEVDVAKVIRGFTSEIIEILRKDTGENELKEIGIRGDCVFAVYSASKQADIYDIANRAIYINTYLQMLNKLLEERELPKVKAGIGLAADKTLAVKAGRKSSGVNNLIWIGEAVTKAANLSDIGNKNGVKPIVMSEIFYINYIKVETAPIVKTLLNIKSDSQNGTYYHGDIVFKDFRDWINSGMKN